MALRASSPERTFYAPIESIPWTAGRGRNNLNCQAQNRSVVAGRPVEGAKSFEQRAVMSLSRLWQQQGKNDEARQMLSEIYSWFTEGFATADLKEAKALLEELS